ncbi:signal peptidase I [Weissella ceti]|uniref:Signal peptidase I n=1 Tax=Weissella ceti TaxID=759620 RepID=A0ABT3E535_9LACO|nr:signal peptidase I [Weissella ceti]MCW0953517.1 signal peptidase I [Weissella ceti]QVK12104.1 signal peptidase I [Weissella ceti]
MKALRSILSWVLPIVAGIIIALVIKTFWFQPVQVDGISMEPNLSARERVLAFKNEDIHRGSVVIFDAYGEDPSVKKSNLFVKRVIGMPGDTVSAQGDVIKVNGKEINQDYLGANDKVATTEPDSGMVGNWKSLTDLGNNMNWERDKSVKVPEGQYFVLGDNRAVSNDSRYWGYVSKEKIMGVVKVPFWGKAAQKENVNNQWETFYKEK